MADWPIYYPDRPDIPYDDSPDSDHSNRKRSQRRLAEAGHKIGQPVKRIPLYAPPRYSRVNEGEKPQ